MLLMGAGAGSVEALERQSAGPKRGKPDCLGRHPVQSFASGAAQTTIMPSEANVILTWPANAMSFILQSTTNLVSPVWITDSQAPVIFNGQNTVTNPVAGTRQFYRLSQ